MFYDEIQKYDWDETTQQIMAKTDADVRRALAKDGRASCRERV